MAVTAGQTGGGVSVSIDPGEWYKLKRDCDAFNPDIIRNLRKRIRNAGNVAADEVRKTLKLPSPDGGPDDGEGRRALAAATKVTISFAQRRAGTRITTSSSKLPEENKGLLLVYNKKTFRHPVFETKRQLEARRAGTFRHKYMKSTRADWVEQKGRPYFGESITRALDKGIVQEIELAVADAVRELANARAAAGGTVEGN